MKKIGIIGSENSHATSFAKSFNLPNEAGNYKYDDLRVTTIFGDKESAEKLAQEANIPSIAKDLSDFSDCDAIMVTSRKGSEHYKYSKSFIEKGLPVFIDKPFTVDISEAYELLDIADKSGSLISGGSACKYAKKVLELKEKIADLKSEKNLISASLNFHIFMDIEYDGFYFYASHLVEMCLTIFGYDAISVTAKRNAVGAIAIVEYSDILVSLNFSGGVGDSFATLYTKKGVMHDKIEIDGIFDAELEVFAQMLKDGKQKDTKESFIVPVLMMNAIVKSYTELKTIYLSDLQK